MPRARSVNFAERESDALLFATASDVEIFDLCRRLGEDPAAVAERIRKLLLTAVRPTPSAPTPPDSPATALNSPAPGLLPLHRILLVDDNPARLADRLDEFRLHKFRLGFVVETATSGREAIAKLQNERFEAVLIELGSPTEEDRRMLESLRGWSTPLAPILLNSKGMEFLELRKLNREAIRALALGFRTQVPPPYRKKGPGRAEAKKPCQSALFESSDEKKSGSS